jgi:hypothetical protein
VNLFLSSLAIIGEKYLFQDKYLVVPGYQAGNVLCKGLIQSGVNWVNLRPETPTGLALRIAGEHLAIHRISVLSGNLSLIIVEELLQKHIKSPWNSPQEGSPLLSAPL